MRSLLPYTLCGVLSLCIPAHAQGLQLFKPVGAATDTWSCNAEAIGQDGGALGVSSQQLIGIDNTCTLANPVNIRDMDAVLYDATCTAEAETSTARVMIMPSPGGVYIIRDQLVFEWEMCAAP